MAMRSAEVVTIQAYELALAADLANDVRARLARNLDEPSRHLAAVRDRQERWSRAGRTMSGSAITQGPGASVWMNVVRANPLSAVWSATGTARRLARRMTSPHHHGPGRNPGPGGSVGEAQPAFLVPRPIDLANDDRTSA